MVEALHQEGLFRVNGNVRAVETLKLRLESGDDEDLFSESDLCTVSSLLKRYLRDLPEGLVNLTVQQKLIQHYHDSRDAVSWWVIKDLLRQLPDVHHSLLRYLCNFLTLVERNHKENRMTAHNLATVVVHTVQPVLLSTGSTELKEEDRPSCDSPAPHIENDLNSLEDLQHLNKSCNKTPKSKKTKVRKGRNNGMPQVTCQPRLVSPSTRSFSIPIVLPLTSELRSPSPEVMNTSPLPELDTLRTASPHVDFSLSGSTEGLSRSVSGIYMSKVNIFRGYFAFSDDLWT
ncbi:hypothetical protein XENOCAPTIV_027276 [Xenoophorus captivus]|uniref:Rho-GAP domain-containing protein n=1 Tax=Xenoophorus captivus TaxID=1517983 RepID=A0ABV0RBK0_9TELE